MTGNLTTISMKSIDSKIVQITTESGIVLLLVSVPSAVSDTSIFEATITWLTPTAGVGNQWISWTWECAFELPEGNWQGKHFKEMDEDDLKLFYISSFPSLTPEQIIMDYGFDPENTLVLIKQ